MRNALLKLLTLPRRVIALLALTALAIVCVRIGAFARPDSQLDAAPPRSVAAPLRKSPPAAERAAVSNINRRVENISSAAQELLPPPESERARLAEPEEQAIPEDPSPIPADDSSSSVYLFDPARTARSVSLLLDEAQRESDEPRNYSAAVGELLSSLGYMLPSTNSRRSTADVELPPGRVGESYCEQLFQADGEIFPALQLASGFYPKGLLLQPGASLCGTPSEAGIFRFSLSFHYGLDTPQERSFRLVITGENEVTDDDIELQLVTSQLPVAQLGAEFSFQLEAEGGVPPYQWLVSGLPAGLEFDAASGLIAGAPEENGEFPLSVTVIDAEGASASLPYSLLVRTTPVFITTSALAEGAVAQVYQERLSAQGGAPPYTWSLASALPDGITFVPASGVFEGTPEREFEGVIRVTVRDRDNASDMTDLPLTIGSNAVRITTKVLADAFEGRNYSFNLSAEGGAPPYQWSAAGIPAGLFIDGNGNVSGTPAAPGDFSISLAVEDNVKQHSNRTVRIRIQPQAELTGGGSGSSSSESTENPPLPGVTDLNAIPSDGKVALVWKNPVHPGFLRVVVTRSDDPSRIIYAGNGTTALDDGLQNGTTFEYSVTAEYSSDEQGASPEKSSASATPAPLSLTGKPDPFADRVAAFSPLDDRCFGCSQMPDIAAGGPHGGGEFQGSTESVVSIGAKVNSDAGKSGPYGGSITLEFTDNIVIDGPGVDFTVFENAFRLAGTDDYFVEPAIVEVSADGENYYRYPVDFVPHFKADGSLNLYNPFCYAQGFAGVQPVYSNVTKPTSPAPTNSVRSGGDQFDLGDLPGKPLSWIRFVRLTSTGDSWMVDQQGDLIRHSNRSPAFEASGKGNSGFDFDAVTAVNY